MKQTGLIFKDKFPELYTLFAGYFAASATDDIVDEDVVISYKKDCLKSEKSKDDINLAILELEQLMIVIDEFWEAVVDSSNLYFENPQDAKVWLMTIEKILKQ